ncbi:MAG: permease [Dehalococcoidales bacterium]|nr:permease [Dehalococcoidales bacterium]
MEIFLKIIEGGWTALLEYLSAHVITCLIPAFFIAGAISLFVSQGAVLKYFGPKAKKWLSYSVASVSGTILAVCSCTVLPLFGGIYKRGAGIGPAIAFLYSGPAINVLAIVYTAQILGFDFGLARAIGAVGFAAGIGLIMAFLFRKDESLKDSSAFDALDTDDGGKTWYQQIIFFVTLVGILVFLASKNWIVAGVFFAVLFVVLRRWFSRNELWMWMKETWRFVKLIVPWLLGGVFAAGIITTFLPPEAVTSWVGTNTIPANFIASILGALMYFATLTEVPIISSFMNLGMHKGPVLALLLAGPALSLPSMLVIRSIMGTKKTLAFIGLVIVFATLTGYVFGLIQ